MITVTLSMDVKDMMKGLSKQQFKILVTLQTKLNKGRYKTVGYFSTPEIIAEFNPDYHLWLMKCRASPFISNRKDSYDFRRFESIRLSVYRSLRSLERRGLIVSFMHLNARCWAILERLGELEKGWVEQDKEYREDSRVPWIWRAFTRTLPKNEKLSKEEILERWEKYKALKVRTLQ